MKIQTKNQTKSHADECMSYSEAIEYIHSTPKFSRVLGNDLLCRLLDKMGNPQSNLRFIHIAGTNGKGSAAAMLSAILTYGGKKTGLYTSPYITRYNERIKLNGTDIDDEDLTRITRYVKSIIEKFDTSVSEFALGTAIAFKYFAECGCDIVVLETGLGGRLDATNVIKSPIVSVLMSIGLDHTQYLGNTVEEITAEKCGIIKDNCPTVVYPNLPPQVINVISKKCKDKNSELHIADMPKLTRGKTFEYNGEKYGLSLDGDYQKFNAATVLTVINMLNQQGYNIPDAAIKKGLKNAQNPARLEKLNCGLILDGAHNPPAIDALCDYVLKKRRPVLLCTAMMEDKDIQANIDALLRLKPRYVIATEVSDMPRCADAKFIADRFKKSGIPVKVIRNPVNAAKNLLKLSTEFPKAYPLVCGSLYLAGEVRRYFADLSAANTTSRKYSENSKQKRYYVYILNCSNNSLYTGYTTNLKKRFRDHISATGRGAKYTHAHKPVSVAAAWSCDSLSAALRLEAMIKKLSKTEKQQLIASSSLKLAAENLHSSAGKAFSDKINCEDFIKVSEEELT